MSSLEIVPGIPLISKSEFQLDAFVECFAEVWSDYPCDQLAIIQANLVSVTWTNGKIEWNGLKLIPAITERVCNSTKSTVTFAQRLLSGSKRCMVNTIAHELRHVWQFATDFANSDELLLSARRVLWEADAVKFAGRFSKDSNYSQLVEFGLPTDDDFDRLVDHWGILTPAMRRDVLERAAGWACDVRDDAKRG